MIIPQKQSGLGRGLGALIPPPRPPVSANSMKAEMEEIPTSQTAGVNVREIPVEKIERNPHQPRSNFEHAALEDLISSIKEHGLIQPLVVTALANGTYQLIAGERRLRAATIAGLATVPAIVRDVSEQQKLEWAIIENVQRQDLNPIEEARAYMRLMTEFRLTQEDVARKVGKSRPQVANTIRLSQLPEPIQQALIERRISASNARTLLSLPTDEERMKLFQAMLAGNFTVRETEERVASPRRRTAVDPNLLAAEDKLRAAYACKVRVKRSSSGASEIKFTTTSVEETEKLLSKLMDKN